MLKSTLKTIGGDKDVTVVVVELGNILIWDISLLVVPFLPVAISAVVVVVVVGIFVVFGIVAVDEIFVVVGIVIVVIVVVWDNNGWKQAPDKESRKRNSVECLRMENILTLNVEQNFD